MARAESRHEQTEVREDWREEADDPHKGPM